MKLLDDNIMLSKIAIDPANPRSPHNIHKRQEELIENTLQRREAKELLKSMRECIRWVNKVVVVSKQKYIEIHPELLTYDFGDSEFVAVEGNTRISCLKSMQIPNIQNDTFIPVLVATQESGEAQDSFLEALLITQGIANVMVVKEWPPHAKAKHVYEMYILKKRFNISVL